MSGIRIASRYAQALLDLSIEKGQLDTVKTDMELLARTFGGSHDLQLMLSSPVVKADKKGEVLTILFEKEISKLTMEFISLLTKKGRESVLFEIVKSFLDQLREYRGITKASVVSAMALDESTKKKIMDLAVKLAGGPVELTESVDASLIGGFKLNVGDQQVDSAISSQIIGLKREFSYNPYVQEI